MMTFSANVLLTNDRRPNDLDTLYKRKIIIQEACL